MQTPTPTVLDDLDSQMRDILNFLNNVPEKTVLKIFQISLILNDINDPTEKQKLLKEMGISQSEMDELNIINKMFSFSQMLAEAYKTVTGAAPAADDNFPIMVEFVKRNLGNSSKSILDTTTKTIFDMGAGINFGDYAHSGKSYACTNFAATIDYLNAVNNVPTLNTEEAHKMKNIFYGLSELPSNIPRVSSTDKAPVTISQVNIQGLPAKVDQIYTNMVSALLENNSVITANEPLETCYACLKVMLQSQLKHMPDKIKMMISELVTATADFKDLKDNLRVMNFSIEICKDYKKITPTFLTSGTIKVFKKSIKDKFNEVILLDSVKESKSDKLYNILSKLQMALEAVINNSLTRISSLEISSHYKRKNAPNKVPNKPEQNNVELNIITKKL